MRRSIVLICNFIFGLLAFSTGAIAQDPNGSGVDMADVMRSEGKIYVVILVVILLFSVLMVYAIKTDRKVTKLEKEVKNISQPQNKN